MQRVLGWGGGGVHVQYEPMKDILTLMLRQDAPIVDVAEDATGTVFGYDANGELVLIEIFDATRNVDKIRDLERILGRMAQRILGQSDTTDTDR